MEPIGGAASFGGFLCCGPLTLFFGRLPGGDPNRVHELVNSLGYLGFMFLVGAALAAVFAAFGEGRAYTPWDGPLASTGGVAIGLAVSTRFQRPEVQFLRWLALALENHVPALSGRPVVVLFVFVAAAGLVGLVVGPIAANIRVRSREG